MGEANQTKPFKNKNLLRVSQAMEVARHFIFLNEKAGLCHSWMIGPNCSRNVEKDFLVCLFFILPLAALLVGFG